MGILSLKIRITLLWVFMAIISVGTGVLEFRQQDLLVKVLGEAFAGPAAQNMSPIFILLPMVMAILTMSLKDRGNRWTNIIVGIIYTLNNISYLAMLIMTKSVPLIVLNIAGVAIAALIFVYALRWPKYE